MYSNFWTPKMILTLRSQLIVVKYSCLYISLLLTDIIWAGHIWPWGAPGSDTNHWQGCTKNYQRPKLLPVSDCEPLLCLLLCPQILYGIQLLTFDMKFVLQQLKGIIYSLLTSIDTKMIIILILCWILLMFSVLKWFTTSCLQDISIFYLLTERLFILY